MSSKTTSFIVFKSQKCRTCYAGRGLRSGVAVRGFVSGRGPPRQRWEGQPQRGVPLRRPLPASHVQMVNISVPSHANMTLTWTDKWQMRTRLVTMSLDKRKRACKTSQHGTAESVTSSGPSPLFSTFLATVVQCYTLTIRKLVDSINAKRKHRNGVLAGAPIFISACNILVYNMLQHGSQN